MSALFNEFGQTLLNGGPVMIVLGLLSLLALTVILAKSFHFIWLRPAKADFVDDALEAWRAGGAAETLNDLSSRRSPLARVLASAMKAASDRGMSEDKAREEVSRVAGGELDRLRSGLRLLALIGALSPLIGLLGTVMGMIEAFQALEAAGSRVDPSILSGGIWVALLTTAAGLVVAIPAVAAHQGFDALVYGARRAMEDAATKVFTNVQSAAEA